MGDLAWTETDDLALDRKPKESRNRLFRIPLKRVARPNGDLALRLLAPSGTRVYLNGRPIVQMARARLRKGASPWPILLQPEVASLIAKDANDLVLRVPADAETMTAALSAELVSGTAPEGGAK